MPDCAKLDPMPPDPHATDAALLARVGDGEERAFEQVWAEHHGRVFRLAYGVLLDRDDAREVAQEVFVALLEEAPRWRPEARLSTWLHRVTVTRSLAWRRGVLRFRRPWSRNRTRGPRPDEALEARRTDARLRDALARLSPRERAVLTLHWEAHLAPTEIAELLDIQPTAARVALHRARGHVRRALDTPGGAT